LVFALSVCRAAAYCCAYELTDRVSVPLGWDDPTRPIAALSLC